MSDTSRDASPSPRPRLPLRERKKLHTRRTIADAALALALEHGVDGVLVEEIAERAFVSPRTLSNYFPSKEAAIVASGADDVALLAEALQGRPSDEAPLASLRAVLAAAVREWSPERLEALRSKERLIASYPALVPHRMAQYDALEDALLVVVAERTGADGEIDPHARLVAGASVSVLKTAVRIWGRHDGDEPTIANLVEAGFDDLEAGLAEG